MFLHPTLDSIAKHFPVDILPNEARGKGGSIYDLFSKSSKKIDENRDYFVEEEATMRIDESLRPDKAKNASDLFGIEGSFKKLDIDWKLFHFRCWWLVISSFFIEEMVKHVSFSSFLNINYNLE